MGYALKFCYILSPPAVFLNPLLALFSRQSIAAEIRFVPIVLAYQAWAYNLFKIKVTSEDLAY
jgi:hypothetical protein